MLVAFDCLCGFAGREWMCVARPATDRHFGRCAAAARSGERGGGRERSVGHTSIKRQRSAPRPPRTTARHTLYTPHPPPKRSTFSQDAEHGQVCDAGSQELDKGTPTTSSRPQAELDWRDGRRSSSSCHQAGTDSELAHYSGLLGRADEGARCDVERPVGAQRDTVSPAETGTIKRRPMLTAALDWIG